ncbi:MAG TPA: NAD-dependent epimerase/dehydratase family protein [Rhizomicrobium sp.]|nr:NAD-dependent epimerase/dehydratase family protein [Rhizomicrobium sp.]
MAETVLVTGGSGFIAGWCVRLLVERGFSVRTTLRDLSKGTALRDVRVFVADLTKDEGWDEAVRGCDYVLHVASPLGGVSDERAFLGPARDGTLRVLAAAARANVKRVVMTSAAAAARPRNGLSVETAWADPDDPQFDAYRRSKILAERAAWEFIKDKTTELATVLPGAVFGPILSRASMGSSAIVEGLLRGRPPGLPRIGFWVVDVRDLAELHVRAMLAPEAGGERFLAAAEFLWMSDIADILRARLGKRAARVPKRKLSNTTVRLLSLFAPQLRRIKPLLGKTIALDPTKARRMLGFAPRPVADTLADCAESLIASWSGAGTARPGS